MNKIRKVTPTIQQHLLKRFYSRSRPQQHEMDKLAKSSFNPALAVTLTFTECPFNGKVNTYNKQQTQEQYEFCHLQFRKFMCRLNKAYLGTWWAKKDKSEHVQVYAVVEISKNKRYHYHLACEIPTSKKTLAIQRKTKVDFQKCITQHWNRFGYIPKERDPANKQKTFKAKPQIDFEEITDNGWIEYITKDLHKDDGLGCCQYSNFS